MGYLTCRASKSEYEKIGVFQYRRIVSHKRYFAIVFVFSVLTFRGVGDERCFAVSPE